MNASFLLDLGPRRQAVNLAVATSDALGKAYCDLLDTQIKAVACVTNVQGFPVKGYLSTMEVASVETAGKFNGRSYVLDCEGIDGSVWRALTGLLFAFDCASTPLSTISLQSDSAAAITLRDQDILTIPYTTRISPLNFHLISEASPKGSFSIEIELRAGITRDRSEEIVAPLNNWLEVAGGGFFNDGEHPVTNAHDCSEFKRVGSRLLVGNFSTYSGSAAAFDVLLNLLHHLQSRHSVIEFCQIH